MVNPIVLIYRNKFALPPLPPPNSFKGKSILITGATSGLGLAVAIHYINLGASSVTITGRTLTKALAAKAQIEEATNTTGKDIIKTRQLDMSTLAETKAFADKLLSEEKKMDVVLLNAGQISKDYMEGKEEFEETIQTNVLSTALLALLLLPWLKRVGGGKAHLGFVASGLHRSVQIKAPKWPQGEIPQYFSQESNFPSGNPDLYGVSKLLEQYVMREIMKLALGSDGSPEVIVNSMCPGPTKSNLARNYKTNIVFSTLINLLMTLAMKTTEGGARTLAQAGLTTAKENGFHLAAYQTQEDYEKEVQHNILGPEGQKMQEQAWKDVLAILEKSAPEVMKIAHPI